MSSETLLTHTLPVAIRPEIELLLSCARTRLDNQGVERINVLIREELDWAYLVELAGNHGLMPLLYWNLHTACPQAAPGDILNLLRGFFHNNARRNLFLSGELLKLLEMLKREGIPAIPFKGPVLADSVYGNLALRSIWDLDILVHKHDVLKVKSMLLAQGYRPENKLGIIGETLHLWLNCEYNFDRDHDNLHVEIHWRIVPGYIRARIDYEGLWERSISLPFVGESVPSPSMEDLLLILCLHNGAKHHWQRLSMICDLAELIGSYQGMDWEWVLEQANRLSIRRVLYLSLLMARDLADARLPQEVVEEALRDPVVESLKIQIQEGLFTDGKDPAGSLRTHTAYIRMRENLGDRLRYLPHIIDEAVTPSDKEEKLLSLPQFFYFLYYLIRPIRLIIKYIGILIKGQL